jgi:hypothetical protein
LVDAHCKFKAVGWACVSRQGVLQDVSNFLLHGPPVAGGPQPQADFDGFVKVAHGDAAHEKLLNLMAMISL